MVISELRPPWPPDEVLELVGMTREEWDEMSDTIERDQMARNTAIAYALEKSVTRRRNELARGE